jgi:hypothetical protein
LNTLIVTPSLPSVSFDVSGSGEVKNEKRFFFSPLDEVDETGTPLWFIMDGEEPSYLSFGIIRRNDGVEVMISQNVVDNFYFTVFRNRVAPVFNKALRNLLNIRNHLLLQLDLECGNITEEYFDKEEPKYLSDVETLPLETLKQQVKVLFGFTNLVLDSEYISEILNCPVDDAEKALKHYISGV